MSRESTEGTITISLEAYNRLIKAEAERDSWHREANRVVEGLRDLKDERDRLERQLKYYQSVLCLDPPIKWWAIREADPVPAVDHERVVDILVEREKLRYELAKYVLKEKP